MKYLLSILLLITYVSPSNTLTGRVVKVADGDTITILTDGNRQVRIRLLDIDAPEKGQDFSEKSRRYLADLVAGKTVTVEWSTKDRYGRILGTVYADNINVNEEMVKAGLAWKYRYSRNIRIAQFESIAKQQKLNIFSLPNPINPYYYRQSLRTR